MPDGLRQLAGGRGGVLSGERGGEHRYELQIRRPAECAHARRAVALPDGSGEVAWARTVQAQVRDLTQSPHTRSWHALHEVPDKSPGPGRWA